jgi:hypothetical protein
MPLHLRGTNPAWVSQTGPGVNFYSHPSHNVPGDTPAKERLESALAEYKRRIAGV